jgi:hypothetical protein
MSSFRKSVTSCLALLWCAGTLASAVIAQQRKQPARPVVPVSPVAMGKIEVTDRMLPHDSPEIFFCSTDTPQCRSGVQRFSTRHLRDLYVFVTWPHLSGTHTQTVQFHLPDGNLYVAKSTTFVVRRGQPGARPSAGNTLPNRFFTTSRGVPAVATLLAVAGTHITQRNLVGNWTVVVLLDGKRAQTAQFQLTDQPL